MTEAQFFSDVTEFIKQRDPDARLDGIDRESDLIRAGILDSLLITDLILHLEERTGHSIPLAKLNLDAIKTIDALYRTYVLKESA